MRDVQCTLLWSCSEPLLILHLAYRAYVAVSPVTIGLNEYHTGQMSVPVTSPLRLQYQNSSSAILPPMIGNRKLQKESTLQRMLLDSGNETRNGKEEYSK